MTILRQSSSNVKLAYSNNIRPIPSLKTTILRFKKPIPSLKRPILKLNFNNYSKP